MRRFIKTTALCLALAAPASADITYQGRDAQGLHCAAMLGVIAKVLYKDGLLSERETEESAMAMALILVQLPGSSREIIQAFRQRADKIIATRSPMELAKEFKSTSKWCRREFLS